MIYENTDAEQGLLASLMLKNNGIHDITLLRGEDFFHPVHGEIFEKIREVVMSGGTASPVTLKPHFENHPDLKDLGGASYLTELMQSAITTINNPEYERAIKSQSTKRFLQSKLHEYMDKLEIVDDGGELAASLTAEIQGTFTTGNRARRKSEVVKEVIEGLEKPREMSPTGLRKLDVAMGGGLYHGWTYGIAGAEKSGKTTLAHTISYNLNEAGTRHVYVALEMGSRQIEEKNIARSAGFNSIKFIDRENRPEDFENRVKTAKCRDETFYLDMPGSSIYDIQAELMPLIYREGCKGIILDYLQIVGGRERAMTEEAHYRKIAQDMANFGRKHNVFIILLAQLNKDNDLFMGGGLTKACDQLYFIQHCADDMPTSKNHRWMKMRASRYTPIADLGSEGSPSFTIRTDAGPYFECF